MSNILRKRKWLFIMVLLVSMLATTVFSIVGFANANKSTVYAAASNSVFGNEMIENLYKEHFGENHEKSTELTSAGQSLDSGAYYMSKDFDNVTTVKAGQTVYFDFNGFRTCTFYGRNCFKLEEGATLYLFDSNVENNYGGVQINNGGIQVAANATINFMGGRTARTDNRPATFLRGNTESCTVNFYAGNYGGWMANNMFVDAKVNLCGPANINFDYNGGRVFSNSNILNVTGDVSGADFLVPDGMTILGYMESGNDAANISNIFHLTDKSKAVVIENNNIVYKNLSELVKVNVPSWIYGEEANTPVVTGHPGNAKYTLRYTGINGTNYDSENAPTEGGKYKLTVTFEATAVYNACAAETEFIVAKGASVTESIELLRKYVFGENHEKSTELTSAGQSLDSGAYYMSKDFDNVTTVKAGQTVYFDFNGFRTCTFYGRNCFKLEEGATLYLFDSNVENNYGGVQINNGGIQVAANATINFMGGRTARTDNRPATFLRGNTESCTVNFYAGNYGGWMANNMFVDAKVNLCGPANINFDYNGGRVFSNSNILNVTGDVSGADFLVPDGMTILGYMESGNDASKAGDIFVPRDKTQVAVVENNKVVCRKLSDYVTANEATKVYNGENLFTSMVVCDEKLGTVKVTYSLTQNGSYSETLPQLVDAGTYTVYFKVTKNAAEYGGTVNLTITPRHIAVRPNDGLQIFYGEEFDGTDSKNYSFLTEYNGVEYVLPLDKDLASLGIRLVAADDGSVGIYVLNVEYAEGLTNYVITGIAGELEILKREVTVRVDDVYTQYGDKDTEFQYSITKGSLASQDTIADLNIRSQRDAGTAVGEYEIMSRYSNANYTVIFEYGKFHIVAREITIVINGESSVYGDAIKQPTKWSFADGSKMAYNEHIDLLGVKLTKEGGAESRTAGKYAITGDWTNKTNYNITFIDGVYEITPKNLKVVIKDRQSVYGEDLADLTDQPASWDLAYGYNTAYGERLSELNILLTKADGLNVGEYDITGEWNNPNYNIEFVNGTYTITPANFDMKVAPYVGIYDGKAHGVIISADGLDIKVQYSLDGKAWQDEAITFTDVTKNSVVYVKISRENYFDYVTSATITIEAKEIAVEWTFNGTTGQNYTWEYDNTAKCPTASVNTGIDGITIALNVSGGATNASDKAYIATAEMAAANANFVLTNTEHEFYIVRAKIDVEVADLDLNAEIFTNGELPELVLKGTAEQLGRIAWDDYVLRADQATYTWTFTPNDAQNYETVTGEFTFTNIKEVAADGIEVSGNAVKNYIYGDEMSREGIVVTVHYSDGSSKAVTGYTFRYENGDFFYAGDTKVTVVVTVSEGVELTKEIDGITVEKKVLQKPATEQGVYKAENQQIKFADGTDTSLFDVEGDYSQVNAGTYTVTLTLKDKDNYKWADSESEVIELEWTIVALTPEIQPEVDVDKTIYTDEALPELNLPEAYVNIGTIEWDAHVVSANKREYAWTFTPNEANEINYTKAHGTVVFNDIRVRQVKNITVTKNPDKMTYKAFETLDLTGMELTVSYEGGKTMVYTQGFEIHYSGGASTFLAGHVSVTVVYDDGVSKHQVILDGFTVEKIKLDAPVAGETEFEYDNTDKTLSIGENDLYTLGGDYTAKNAGAYTATVTLKDFANYEWKDAEGAEYAIEWNIRAREITVTIDNQSSEYGSQAELTWKITSGSLADGESEADLNVTLTWDGKDVGEYEITGEYFNGNYVVDFVKGTYEVKKKTVKVTVDSVTVQYGDSDAPLTWRLQEGEELAYGENLEILGVTMSRDPGKSVGRYTIRLSYDNKNYNIEFESGLYEIIPREITIVIHDQTSVYGAEINLKQSAWELAAGSILAPGENISVLNVVLAKKDADKDAGDYSITGTWTSKNYNVTFVDGTYTVTPKAITVDVFSQTSVYGEELAEMGLNAWRLAAGSTLAYNEGREILNVLLRKAEGDNVGLYDIICEWNNKNYTITFNGYQNAYEITKAERTAEVRPYNGEYDGQGHTVFVETIDGDTVWYRAGLDGEWTTEPLNFTDVINGAMVYVKITNDNYVDFIAHNTVTITPKEITLTWKGNGGTNDFSYIYTGKDTFCPTAEADSGIDGIVLNVTVIGGQVDASEKPYIAEAMLDNANFSISNPTQQFYINPSELSIRVEPKTDTDSPLYAYGKLPELRLSGEEQKLGAIAWDTYTITPGTYTYRWTYTPFDTNYAKQHGEFTFASVIERYVTNVTLDDSAVNKIYTAFGKFDPSGLKVILHFNDGTTEEADYNTGVFVYESGEYFLVAHTRIMFKYTAMTEEGEKTFELSIDGITVNKLEIELPETEGELTYTGEKQSPNIATSEYYEISGDEAIDAGTYGATLSLTDPENTMWKGGTNDVADKTVEWKIGKATLDIKPSCDTVTTIWTSERLPDLQLSPADQERGTIAWDPYKLSADQKTYSWTFTPFNTDNYNVVTGEVTFQNILKDTLDSLTVNSEPVDKTYTAFEGLSKEGLSVTANFRSGKKRDLDNGELTINYVNGGNSFRVGETQVEISFTSEGVTKHAVISGITVNPVLVTAPDVEGKELIYNGQEQSVGNVVSDSYNIEGDVKGTNAGEYTFTISLKDKVNYAWTSGGTDDIVVNWSIGKATINTDDLKFDDMTVTYDGSKHSISVSGLPEGVTVTYEGNEQTNAGTYTVTAKFAVGENYNEIADMTATLTINKATIDMSGVKFENMTVKYDGKSHSIEVTGLPDGVTVTYVGNGQTEVGKYTVTAKFAVGENYEAIADMTAELTIETDGTVDPTPEEKDNTGLVIGLSAGGVVIFGLVVLAIVLIRRKRRG